MQQLTATSYAGFLQVANAFLKVRSAQHFLHLRLSSVHLIQFCASKSAPRLAKNR